MEKAEIRITRLSSYIILQAFPPKLYQLSDGETKEKELADWFFLQLIILHVHI